jgi:hypothetical protein
MKKHLVFGLIGLSSLGLLAADGSGTASVRLVKPLRVEKGTDLWFGDYILNTDPTQNGTASSIMVEQNTDGSAYNDVQGNAIQKYIGHNNLGQPHVAKFTIYGETGFTVQVNAPGAAIPMTSPTGSATLTLNAKACGPWEWTSTTYAAGSFSIALMDGVTVPGQSNANLTGTGQAEFYVGGVLDLPAGSGSGKYSGSFNVSVAYN